MQPMEIRALGEADHSWLKVFFEEHWGGATMVYGAKNQLFVCDELPGFVAWQNGEVVGLLTYCEAEAERQIVSLDSLQEGIGVGTALMRAAEEDSQRKGQQRIWLLTTNDNLNALRFYQKRGYVLVAVHRQAVEAARQLKPSIPQIGNDGISLRDELELEKVLD